MEVIYIKEKKVTISDIATKAGVSKATVSRVLNNPEIVDVHTRELIEQIMRDTHYSPSATARNLSTQVSSTIGVIVPEINNTFFGELFSGIEDVINKNNLSLLFCSNDDKLDKDYKSLGLMQTQRVRGLIYIPAINYSACDKTEEVQRKLDRLDCPVVCVDRSIGLKCDEVYFDDRNAMCKAVRALVEQGHDKIAIINGETNNVLAVQRYQIGRAHV